MFAVAWCQKELPALYNAIAKHDADKLRDDANHAFDNLKREIQELRNENDQLRRR